MRRQARFDQSFAECEQFWCTHGRPPSRSAGDGEEKRLGAWLHQRRWEAKNDNLALERLARLEPTPWFRVSLFDVDFEARLNECEQFWLEHGRGPLYDAVDRHELSLHSWIQDKRTRRLSLSADRVTRLEATEWFELGTWDHRFDQHFNEFRQFWSDHDRHPKIRAGGATERALAIWLNTVRDRRSTLTTERLSRLEATEWFDLSAWDHQFNRGFYECEQFWLQHSRKPFRSSLDEHEARLGSWIETRHRDNNNGALKTQRLARLDATQWFRSGAAKHPKAS